MDRERYQLLMDEAESARDDVSAHVRGVVTVLWGEPPPPALRMSLEWHQEYDRVRAASNVADENIDLYLRTGNA